MQAAKPSNSDPGLIERVDDAGITRLTLNRPAARNALSNALMEALCEQLQSIGADRSIRVVVLAGEGPGFCAGHDLKEMRSLAGADAYAAVFALCSRLMLSIVRLPQPVIARVHGMATAAGCQLVASCDLAVASEQATFATPGVNIGLFCSTPMVALSRNVARKHAMEMLLTGEPISAERALQIGLVNRVVAPESLDENIEALAGRIAGRSAASVRIGKRGFYEQLEQDLEQAYEYTSAVMVRNMLEDDANEGISAFLEKRQPHWSD